MKEEFKYTQLQYEKELLLQRIKEIEKEIEQLESIDEWGIPEHIKEGCPGSTGIID